MLVMTFVGQNGEAPMVIKKNPDAGLKVNRRQFFKISAAGLGTTSLIIMGLAPTEARAEVRQYKLTRSKEIRNTCTYCSVGCGLLMYSLGDGAKNAKANI